MTNPTTPSASAGALLARAGLFLRTARHLRADQVWARGRRVVVRRLREAAGRRAPKPQPWRVLPSIPLFDGLNDAAREGSWSDEAREAVSRAKGVARGEFLFLNRRVKFGSEIGWHDPELSRLWRYHLHYFDYVFDLLVWSAVERPAAAYGVFRSLADSWIAADDLIRGDGWHPYTISIRAVNWLAALSGFQEELRQDDGFRRRLVSSLCGQMQVLAGDMETDVRGNHLLANLRALILFGLACPEEGPARWHRHALVTLEEELGEQVLADGGHFERSPAYHLIVLEHCLEIAVAFVRNGRTPPPWLDDAVRRMLEYLVGILPSDGRLPLLKDTARDSALSPDALLASGALYLRDPAFKRDDNLGLYPLALFGASGAELFGSWPLNTARRTSAVFAESGIVVMRDDARGDHAIFDVGKPCPDYLPAHAHADLLSYELTLHGRPLVVDSGVYEYASGRWRDYFRSTRAHNTVEVDGVDQSEVWNSFRVGRRARPFGFSRIEREGCTLVQCSHDGYRRLRPRVCHRRTVAWKPGHFWLVLDEVLGSGQAHAASFVHFHPDLAVKPLHESAWQVDGHRAPLWIEAFGAESASVVRGRSEPSLQGWYSERFGEIAANCVLVLSRAGALPFHLGYALFERVAGTVRFAGSGEGRLLVVTHEGLEVSWSPKGTDNSGIGGRLTVQPLQG